MERSKAWALIVPLAFAAGIFMRFAPSNLQTSEINWIKTVAKVPGFISHPRSAQQLIRNWSLTWSATPTHFHPALRALTQHGASLWAQASQGPGNATSSCDGCLHANASATQMDIYKASSTAAWAAVAGVAWDAVKTQVKTRAQAVQHAVMMVWEQTRPLRVRVGRECRTAMRQLAAHPSGQWVVQQLAQLGVHLPQLASIAGQEVQDGTEITAGPLQPQDLHDCTDPDGSYQTCSQPSEGIHQESSGQTPIKWEGSTGLAVVMWAAAGCVVWAVAAVVWAGLLASARLTVSAELATRAWINARGPMRRARHLAAMQHEALGGVEAPSVVVSWCLIGRLLMRETAAGWATRFQGYMLQLQRVPTSVSSAWTWLLASWGYMLTKVHEAHVMRMQERLDTSEASATAFKADAGKVKAQLKGVQQHSKQLQQDYTQLQEGHTQLQHDSAQLQQGLSLLQQQHAQLEHDNSGLQQGHTQLQQQHAQLDQQHGQLLQQHARLQQQHTDLQHSSTQLRQQHTQLQHSHTQLRQQQTALQQQHSHLQQQHTQLQQDNTQLNSRLEQAEAAVKLVSAQKEGVELKLEVSHLELKALDNTLQQLGHRLEGLEQQIRHMQQEAADKAEEHSRVVEQLQGQLQDSAVAYETHQDLLLEANEHITELHRAKAELERNVASIQAQSRQLQGALQEVEGASAAKDTQLGEKDRQLRQAMDQVEQLKAADATQKRRIELLESRDDFLLEGVKAQVLQELDKNQADYRPPGKSPAHAPAEVHKQARAKAQTMKVDNTPWQALADKL